MKRKALDKHRVSLEKLIGQYSTRLDAESKRSHTEYQERRLWNDTVKTYCQLVQTLVQTVHLCRTIDEE